MRVSTRVEYGVRAALEIARHKDKRPIRRKEISKLQGIPDSYLENILISLKDGGIVATIRGINGGYVLKRPAKDISLLDIVEVLEGPVRVDDQFLDAEKSNPIDFHITGYYLGLLVETERNILGNIMLQDLVQRTTIALDFSI
jgi:Rrf2 family protein